MTPFLARYESKIMQLAETGCMIWMGATTKNGYGICSAGFRSPAGHSMPEGTHRASYRSRHGAIPDGASVLHKCDVPACVNPDHLFIGNQDANMKDMASKRRSCIGERHHRAIMTEPDVIQIRKEYRFRQVTAKDLADKYGFKEGAVAAAIRRQTWRHLQ